MAEIVVDNELVPRSIGERVHSYSPPVNPRSIGESRFPHQILWTPFTRNLGFIPAAAYTGETPIHRAQRTTSIFLTRFPLISRPAPILKRLRGALPIVM
jgi:hypothetical protein